MVCPRRDSGSDEAGAKKGSFANAVQKFQSKSNRMGGSIYVEKLIGSESNCDKKQRGGL